MRWIWQKADCAKYRQRSERKLRSELGCLSEPALPKRGGVSLFFYAGVTLLAAQRVLS